MMRLKEKHSSAIQEIFGKPPIWIIRWGITIMFMILIGFFTACYFIKYSEIITTKIEIKPTSLPTPLIMQHSGQIDTLLVKNGARVNNGTIIAVLKNRANTKDITQYLQDSLEAGIQDYVITSVSKGVISLNGLIDKRYVTKGDTLGLIIPDNIKSVRGYLQLTQDGLGMIKEGQTVNIKLNSYPYMEFGMLRGELAFLSIVPKQINSSQELVYCGEVVFPNGLRTTYNKELPTIYHMAGVAEIVVNRDRLIKKFIQPIVLLFKN